MNKEDWRSWALVISVDGQPAQVRLDVVWPVYKAAHVLDFHDAVCLASFGAAIARSNLLGGGGIFAGMPIGELDQHNIRVVLEGLSANGGAWKTEADPVLSFTYTLLRRGTINRNQAAIMARDMLQDPEINTESWRKRVDRWAKNQEPRLPPVGKPRQRE